jgi:Protein of unknown function (DUF2917)
MQRMPAAARSDDTMVLRLRAGEFLPLRAAQGRSVAVVRGRLWIAQDDGQHEAFVGQGQTFALDEPGGATLHALEPSSLQLTSRGPSRPRAGWRQRLLGATRRWAGG